MFLKKPHPKSLSQGEGLWVWWVEVFGYLFFGGGCFVMPEASFFFFCLNRGFEGLMIARIFWVFGVGEQRICTRETRAQAGGRKILDLWGE
jgi:hypothetical protein